MRDNYVICMKNAMFWHFGTSEIRDVLEDVSLHFESGLRDGLSENDILEQYGEPRDAVSIIKKEEGREHRLYWKCILPMAVLVCVLYTASRIRLYDLLNYVSVICAVFIWFLSGNSCLAGILPVTYQKKKETAICQAAVLFLFCIFQFCAYTLLPQIYRSMQPGSEKMQMLAENIIRAMCVASVLLLAMCIFSAWKMLHGNIYMYFILIQCIALICSAGQHYLFLANKTVWGGWEFLSVPYFLCVPILALYWVFFLKRPEVWFWTHK